MLLDLFPWASGAYEFNPAARLPEARTLDLVCDPIATLLEGVLHESPEEVVPELGYTFETETDTEALVHLIDEAFGDAATLEDAVFTALNQVEGAYGVAVVSSRDPAKIVAARRGSPLLIGLGKNGENLVGSDAAAVIQHTKCPPSLRCCGT